ncbi:MAG: glycerol kinase GlpK [Bacteroidales bacterium]|nr:glycerol kinase GlpK [Bacteroidales bacterium]
MPYILSIDQGTSSSRTILFNQNAEPICTHQVEIHQFYPQQDYVEQNPVEILNSQLESAQTVLRNAKIDNKELISIGITNQRETTIIWNKKTGKAIYNAIVWQDQRTKAYCQTIDESTKKTIHKKTGLIVDPYFSATKIKWILDTVPEARKMANNNELLFGTVDCWLVWNLSKGSYHITDVSNASRTMLFNINTLEWDTDLLELFDIPKSILPNVVASSGKLAQTDPSIFGISIPIGSMIGDQQAALFGQTCFDAGMIKNTYGTGCFMLMNTGKKAKLSENGLLTTIAWKIGNETSYALEGSIFMAGAAIKWLRDQLQLIKDASETESLAYSVENNGGVIVIPAFSGLGAPYWNADVNGTVLGLTLGTNKAHIVRATLESIAYRTKDILSIMEKESGTQLTKLSADGGAANNQFLMQFQSDLLNIPVQLSSHNEITALGAAYLAGIAAGIWDIEQIKKIHQISQTYQPKMKKNESKQLYQAWLKAVKKHLSI